MINDQEIADNLKSGKWTQLAGDASSRQYYRAENGLYLHDEEGVNSGQFARFLDIAQRLARAGIKVPQIYECDASAGWIYLEDLGDKTLKSDGTAKDYLDAIDFIKNFSKVDCEGLPAYDFDKFYEETSRLNRFYLQALGIDDAENLGLMVPILEEFSYAASGFVHVDYMSENIMLIPNGLGILDFQDARLGHQYYDYVSVIDDVRVHHNDEAQKAFYQRGFQRELTPSITRDCALLSAQRLMKILGIFARQTAMKKTKYQSFMPDIYERIPKRFKAGSMPILAEWFLDIVPYPDEQILKRISDD